MLTCQQAKGGKMTCEIVIMNQHAVALAADSAMTVERWVNNKKETRYFKGSNKIFQLTHNDPVGLMIFDTALLQGVPWDLIVKEYRNQQKVQYPTLKEYADSLFAYIAGSVLHYPQARRIDLLLGLCQRSTYILLTHFSGTLNLKEAPPNPVAANTALDAAMSTLLTTLNANGLHSSIPAYADQQALATHGIRITEAVTKLVGDSIAGNEIAADYAFDIAKLCQLTVAYLYRHFDSVMPRTGMVFSGYGTEELFPSYLEYEIFGLLDNVLVRKFSHSAKITPESNSYVKPFATTQMVDTFLLGFSPDVLKRVSEEFQNSIQSLITQISAAHGINTGHTADDIAKLRSEFSDRWTDAVTDNHFQPIRQVIGSLPTSEMAELAETMIMLESLRERVTADSQSVSGPIDVAVITRNEGFIWIKRKHYFDAEKNPRYLMRQKLIYQ